MISEFPVFTGKIEHAHTVCTRPSLSQREGAGDEANSAPCTWRETLSPTRGLRLPDEDLT